MQRKCKGNTKEIQRKYIGNTKEIQRKHKGNTKEIQGKGAPKSSKKHYLEKVSQHFAGTSKNLINPVEFHVLRNAKTRRGNPYKTLLKLIISRSFSENGLQNHWKSITFFTINHMAFRRVEKPYKTCRK